MDAGLSLLGVVVTTAEASSTRVLGLTLTERARRATLRAGAGDAVVVTLPQGVEGGADEGAAAAANTRAMDAVALLRATVDRAEVRWLMVDGTQVVHTDLLQPLVTQLAGASAADKAAGSASATSHSEGSTYAVAPEDHAAPDLAAGAFAGAVLLAGRDKAAALAAWSAANTGASVTTAPASPSAWLARIAAQLSAANAPAIAHGDLARYPATTPAERRGATRHLLQILHKTQDNLITRFLLRPFSRPLSKLFVHTPITPNQLSMLTGVIALYACYLSSRPSYREVVMGTGLILGATIFDCCDGEVARLKLMSSKFGAWLDTIIDEMTSLLQMLALGWHARGVIGHAWWPEVQADVWLIAMVIGAATYALAIYVIYFNIIVAVGSANSQDYAGAFEVEPVPERANTVRLRPQEAITVPTDAAWPVRFAATYLPHLVRRDFIVVVSVLAVALGGAPILFGFMVLGGLVSAAIVSHDHLALRKLLRSLRARGLTVMSARSS